MHHSLLLLKLRDRLITFEKQPSTDDSMAQTTQTGSQRRQNSKPIAESKFVPVKPSSRSKASQDAQETKTMKMSDGYTIKIKFVKSRVSGAYMRTDSVRNNYNPGYEADTESVQHMKWSERRKHKSSKAMRRLREGHEARFKMCRSLLLLTPTPKLDAMIKKCQYPSERIHGGCLYNIVPPQQQQVPLLRQLHAQYPNVSQADLKQMLIQKIRELYARQQAQRESQMVLMRQSARVSRQHAGNPMLKSMVGDT